jgi:hypothetical protein
MNDCSADRECAEASLDAYAVHPCMCICSRKTMPGAVILEIVAGSDMRNGIVSFSAWKPSRNRRCVLFVSVCVVHVGRRQRVVWSSERC